MGIPLLNLGRSDLVYTLMLSFVFMGAALAGRHFSPASADHHSYPWIFGAVACSSIASLVLFFMAVAKICCGHGDSSSSARGPRQGYETLEEYRATTARPYAEQQQHVVGPGGLSNALPYDHAMVQQYVVSGLESHRSGTWADPYDAVVTAGILLKRAEQPFEHYGVQHSAGLYRVISIENDSPCHRQGACDIGDVIISVDGRPLFELTEFEVSRLLRGPAGTSILIRLFSGPTQEPIVRHLVLAPSPSSLLAGSYSTLSTPRL